ncbi:MAG TPA: PDZ domain-containing protein [Thermoanaerobaculia bacterium]|nr:PDZ domain-containing protein [Thermoanaerobaculia bacterium]
MKHVVLIVTLWIATTVHAGSVPARPTTATDSKPWLGMSVRPFRDQNGERMLHVERVTAGGPGARAGMLPGDIITRVNGNALQHVDDLDFLTFVGARKPGERLTFQVVRTGRSRTIVVTVGTMPDSARAGWELALQNARRVRAATQRKQ